ncbi:MAG: siderophore-interacting protein [Gammaproteobacteria bacterium]|nr:siderophore-interacting protein [Gammaproteobacteria bacterium]
MAKNKSPKILTVAAVRYLSPNMIRVTFQGPELSNFPEHREGANCKLLLPEPQESREAFLGRIKAGEKPTIRTYTVRHYRSSLKELDIDFVAHGDKGPASRWATHAKAGDFLGFFGPGLPKLTHFDADWYLLAADPSALPMLAAALEAMPDDATGVAIIEITSEEDKLTLKAPAGIEIKWLVHSDPHVPSTQQQAVIRDLRWPDGRVQTCIAGETSAIRAIKQFIKQEKNVAAKDSYISGYWKIGLVEDEHQQMKRSEGN